MNIGATLSLLGSLLLFLAVALLTPIPFAMYYEDGALSTFLTSAGVTAVVGLVMFLSYRTEEQISYREGFGVVTFAWICFAFFGGLPYLIAGVIPSVPGAFFEAMSGFTTTGSTVITDLSVVPKSILLWRSETQWLGGMGIIVLSLAILPFLGVGGMQLFQAEVPGPTKDRLSPRIQDTAKLLWGVYCFLTVIESLLLMLGGMDFFEAISHAFTTMATGGFSTENKSVAAWDSSYIHWVITVFMFLAGINFAFHFQALLRGRFGVYLRSQELAFYAAVCIGATMAVAILNADLYDSVHINIRDAAFQVVGIATTTGYATADYELWPVLAQYIIMTLMFMGACAGSTAGGMKVVRWLLILKHAFLQVFQLIHPKGVRQLKLDSQTVDDQIMQAILGFFALYLGLFVFGSFVMAGTGLDLVSAGAAALTCLSNIGPGLGSVGPTDNFAHITSFGLLFLSTLMLIGRLEIFTVLVLFSPGFWKK